MHLKKSQNKKHISALTRILHFPLLSPRSPAPARPPTQCRPCVSILAPVHSKFPPMDTELCRRAQGIRFTCVSHTTAQGSEHQRSTDMRVGYLKGSCDIVLTAGEWKNIPAALHNVVTAAWLFIRFPLLRRRKPLLLDADVSGRTDSSPTERWQPGPGQVL